MLVRTKAQYLNSQPHPVHDREKLTPRTIGLFQGTMKNCPFLSNSNLTQSKVGFTLFPPISNHQHPSGVSKQLLLTVAYALTGEVTLGYWEMSYLRWVSYISSDSKILIKAFIVGGLNVDYTKLVPETSVEAKLAIVFTDFLFSSSFFYVHCF